MPPSPLAALDATSLLALLALFALGGVAAAINAVAGGGSLVVFPALIGFGLSTTGANATTSAALWPGSMASAIGYWPLVKKKRREVMALALPTALGSAAGAWLLVNTPERAFKMVVPGLVLCATLLLAFQPRIRAWLGGKHRRVPRAAGFVLQLAVCVYGGYFGAGMGILMLAIFGLFIEGSIHELNGLKTALSLLVNLLASAMFVAQGLVRIGPALAVMTGAIAGGYIAAKLAPKAPAEATRRVVVVLGFLMTAWFTWKIL